MIIQKLKLVSFGKFSNCEFEFKPITVFWGNNESGKSTLFDAIFDRISSPPGNTVEGRRLASRYGNNRNAEIIWNSGEVIIPSEEFLNLYAIGAGSVDMDFSSKGEWTQRIKASIFSGGIDPANVAQELDRLASEGGNYQHVRILRGKEQELEKSENSLNILNARKKEILAAEKEMDSKQQMLNELQNEIAHLTIALDEGEKSLEQQELHRKLEEVRATMEHIVRYEQTAQRNAALELYRQDMSEALQKLHAELEEKKRVFEHAGRVREQIDERKREVSLHLKEGKAKSERLRIKSVLASELLRRIEENTPKEIISLEVQWHPVGIAVMAVSIILGSILFLYLYPSSLAFIPLAAALAISSIAALFSRKKREVRERPDTGNVCAALKDEWKIRTGEELVSATLEGLQRELVRIQSEADSLDKEIAELANMEASLAGKIAEADRAWKKADEDYEEVRKRREDLFRDLKIHSSEEYAAHRTKYESVQRELQDITEIIAHDLKRYSVKSIDELKAVCHLRQSSLEKDCVSARKSEIEINRLKNEIAKKKEQLNKLQTKYVEVKSDIERCKGEVKGALGDLPQSIYEKEKEIEMLKRDIKRLRIDMEAAGVARDIFLDISRNADIVFSELENDIGLFLSEILEGERKIEFRDFNENSISITDASGRLRNIEKLSTGTKDAFVMAARFCFARKSWRWEQPGILVLDEPFHSLDRERIARTVELIIKFHREYGWQIVLFTKDEELANALMTHTGENAIRHSLSR